MSEIKRFDIPRNGNEFMHEDPDGEYVLYDDHLAEMFRMRAEVDRLTAERDLGLLAGQRLRGEVERLTAERQFMEVRNTVLARERDGWRSDTEQMTAERDAARAEVERLTQELDGRRATNQRVMAERDAARANAITDAREKNGIISRLVEQRDAAQAEVERLPVRLEHAETRIVPPLPHTGESAPLVQDKMDAYVTSLNAELHEAREMLARVQTQYDEFARVTAKTIGQHQRERDEARQQVYRLQQACGDTGANGQGMLDTSRPTDEDIWREAFMRQLFDHDIEKLMGAADLALALYRKRWPR